MTRHAIDALWYTRCAVPTPFSFAAQFGWFEEEFAADGFPVRSLRESARPEELASHFEHNLDNSFRQGGSVPAIWARSKGQDTRVVAVTWTDEYQAIIALPDSKIRTIKDLKGRRVGLPKHDITIDHNRASALRAFEVALDLEGLSVVDVQLVDLHDADYVPSTGEVRTGLTAGGRERHSYANEAYALVRREVDAIYVKDVRGAELAYLLGAVVVADLGFHPDPFVRISNCTPRPLTVSGPLLSERPDIVDRFLARVVRAGEWAKTHPDETVTAISRETGWSEKWIRRAYGDKVHLNLDANLDPASVTGLGQFVAYLADGGFIPDNFDVHAWVDPRPYERVSLAARFPTIAKSPLEERISA